MLTPQEEERYSRQILFEGIGPEGQKRLGAATVAIVGCGALGSFHAAALARAGVGRLRVIDRDYVEPSNLQRQWLFDEEDAAQVLPKAAAAERQITRINSGVMVEPRVADLTPENARELLGGAGVILDGTDNFETRYLINDVAVEQGTPWIYGAAVGSYGVVMPVIPGCSACLACVFPEPPGGTQPTCDTAGIVNAVASLVASYQVAHALKILTGQAEGVDPQLLSFDVWKQAHQTLSVQRPDPECVVCAQRHFVHLEGGRRRPIVLCGRDAVQINEHNGALDLGVLRARLETLGPVRANEYVVRFAPPPYEMTIFADGRAIIKGTQDPTVARSLYARYVGN